VEAREGSEHPPGAHQEGFEVLRDGSKGFDKASKGIEGVRYGFEGYRRVSNDIEGHRTISKAIEGYRGLPEGFVGVRGCRRVYGGSPYITPPSRRSVPMRKTPLEAPIYRRGRKPMRPNSTTLMRFGAFG
jgi:hypothetical protein